VIGTVRLHGRIMTRLVMGVCISFLFSATAVHATVVPTVEGLFRDSDVIVVGKVLEVVNPGETDRKVTISIDRVLHNTGAMRGKRRLTFEYHRVGLHDIDFRSITERDADHVFFLRFDPVGMSHENSFQLVMTDVWFGAPPADEGLINTITGIECEVVELLSSRALGMGPAMRGGIPDEILQTALCFIASRAGEDFCQRYVVFDPGGSKPNPEGPGDFPGLDPRLVVKPSFKVVFRIAIPDKPYVQGRIQFIVDGKGKPLAGSRVYGIPDCVDHPEECNFPIDKAMAVRLAQDSGLEQGLRTWEAAFTWRFENPDDPILGTYAWEVSNTTSCTRGGMSGSTLVLDANSGEILDRMGWAKEWGYE
jgi:hypothetical protein